MTAAGKGMEVAAPKSHPVNRQWDKILRKIWERQNGRDSDAGGPDQGYENDAGSIVQPLQR